MTPIIERKLFFVFIRLVARHNLFVIGAFINTLGILLGALLGLLGKSRVFDRFHEFHKSALGAVTVFLGFRLVWENLGGTFPVWGKQIAVALLAVALGNVLGRLLGLQKMSNRLGRYAGGILAGGQMGQPKRSVAGLTAATVLYCAAPLGIIGAVTDGLIGYYQLLVLKAVMDGVAMAGFVKLFSWPVALAALPVFIFEYACSSAVRFGVAPWLEMHALIGIVCITAGLLVSLISLVILGLRRVELANYLPALVMAPLLDFWVS